MKPTDDQLQDAVDELAARLLVAAHGMPDDSGVPDDANSRRYQTENAFKMAEMFIGIRERRRGRL